MSKGSCFTGLQFFYKKFSGTNTSDGAVKNEIMSNQELAQELHQPIVRKFEKRKVYSSFKANICGAVVVDIQLISKFTKINSFFMYYWFFQ